MTSGEGAVLIPEILEDYFGTEEEILKKQMLESAGLPSVTHKDADKNWLHRVSLCGG